MPETLFDKIIKNEIPNWKVWEDDNFLAFLTPFANTPGMTIVIPKKNPGDYIFNIDNNLYSDFMNAVKTVAKILEKAFSTSRIALVFEGTGVAHVHAKLYPLHGELASQTNVWSTHTEFYPKYVGYLTTVEGPKISDDELNKIQKQIQDAQNN